MNLHYKKIQIVLKQLERFDKNYSAIYHFRLLIECMKKTKIRYVIDKKKFIKYMELFRNKKINLLSNNRDDIYILFVKEFKKILKQLKKLQKKIFFDFIFIKSKNKSIFNEMILNFEKILKKLNPYLKKLNYYKKKSYGRIFITKLFENIVFIFENINSNLYYKVIGNLVSKIYIQIKKKVNVRKSLQFFFNDTLLILVNTNLFKDVFKIDFIYLKNRILEILYERLYLNPMKLESF
jgi:hypothetical protein